MSGKDEVQSLNPRYGGATPEDVARALVRPRSWEARDAEGTEEEAEANMVTMWC